VTNCLTYNMSTPDYSYSIINDYLYSLKVVSSLYESNGLMYKPHLWFLAQNLSKKVQLIHECYGTCIIEILTRWIQYPLVSSFQWCLLYRLHVHVCRSCHWKANTMPASLVVLFMHYKNYLWIAHVTTHNYNNKLLVIELN